MADLFLSYAHEDREAAELIARAATKSDLSVWWDHLLRPGQDFDLEIDRQLQLAKCVTVLWSKHSIFSLYVRDEAQDGLDDGKLVPVSLDHTRPPRGFRRLQTMQLSEFLRDPVSATQLKSMSVRVAEPPVELEENHVLPVIIYFDTTGSMFDFTLRELDHAMRDAIAHLQRAQLGQTSVELCVISAKHHPIAMDKFTDIKSLKVVLLYGGEQVTDGLQTALREARMLVSKYRSLAVPYWRPWLFLFTQCDPVEEWRAPIQELLRAEADGEIQFQGVGIGDPYEWRGFEHLVQHAHLVSIGPSQILVVFRVIADLIEQSARSSSRERAISPRKAIASIAS